jgi:hypothetical protein
MPILPPPPPLGIVLRAVAHALWFRVTRALRRLRHAVLAARRPPVLQRPSAPPLPQPPAPVAIAPALAALTVPVGGAAWQRPTERVGRPARVTLPRGERPTVAERSRP